MNSWEDGMVRAVLLSVVLGLSGCRCAVDELDSGLGEVVVTAGEDAGTGDAGSGDAGASRPPPDVRPSGCWSQPVTLADPALTALLQEVQLVVLPAGEALFLHWTLNDESLRLLARVVAPDGQFSAPEEILVAPSPHQQNRIEYHLAANAEGHVALVWSSLGQENAVFVRRYHPDAGWRSVTERVTVTSPELLGRARVAVNGRGHLTVAWQEARTNSAGILMVRREGAAGWTAPEAISPHGGVLGDWALRASDELTALAWDGYFPPTFAWTGASTIWTASARIDHQFALTDQGPGPGGLSFDVFGQHAVFATGGFVATLAGETWSVSQPLASTSSMIGAPELVGLEPDGLATLWWQTFPPGPFSLLSARQTAAGWTAPEVLEREAEPAVFLVHGSGPRSVVAWLRDPDTVIRRSGLDGGVELIGRFVPISLSVGASGTIWMVGQARFDDRVIALVCP